MVVLDVPVPDSSITAGDRLPNSAGMGRPYELYLRLYIYRYPSVIDAGFCKRQHLQRAIVDESHRFGENIYSTQGDCRVGVLETLQHVRGLKVDKQICYQYPAPLGCTPWDSPQVDASKVALALHPLIMAAQDTRGGAVGISDKVRREKSETERIAVRAFRDLFRDAWSEPNVSDIEILRSEGKLILMSLPR